MNDSHSNAASDLIYLYLDGEADNVQHAMLFGALARNSELQAEFTEALRLRAAVEQERAAALPPAHLGEEIFRKAGFGATGEGIVTTTSPSAPGTGVLGTFGSSILSAALSAILTGLLVTALYQSRYDDLAGELARMRYPAAATEHSRGMENTMTSDSAAGAIGDRAFPLAAADEQHAAAAMAARERNGEDVPRAAGTQSPDRATPPPLLRSGRGMTSPALGSTERGIGASMSDGGEETPNRIAERPLLEPAYPRIAPPLSRDAAASVPAGIGGMPIEHDPPFQGIGEEEPEYRFALQLRGITGLRLYPERSAAEVADPWFNNMSIGALYQLSEHHAIGIEGGQEMFPLYRSDGTESWLQPRLAWGGGIYRFESDGIETLGRLRPFAQGMLGATASGPITKGIVGITYTPDSRVDLSVGFEGTALFYQLQGTWYSTRKTGITYLMNVHF